MWCLWRETRLNNFAVAIFIFHPVDLCLIDVFYERVINLLEARTSICFGRSTGLMRRDEFRSEIQEKALSHDGLQPDTVMFKCPLSYAASESKNSRLPTVPGPTFSSSELSGTNMFSVVLRVCLLTFAKSISGWWNSSFAGIGSWKVRGKVCEPPELRNIRRHRERLNQTLCRSRQTGFRISTGY